MMNNLMTMNAVWQAVGVASAVLMAVSAIAMFKDFFGPIGRFFGRFSDYAHCHPIRTVFLVPMMVAIIAYSGSKGIQQVTFVSPVEKGEIEVGDNYISFNWTMKDSLPKSQYKILRAPYNGFFSAWSHTNKNDRTDIVPVLPTWTHGSERDFWLCGYSAPDATTTERAGGRVLGFDNSVYEYYGTEVKYDPYEYGSTFIRKTNNDAFEEVAVLTGVTSYREDGIDPSQWLWRVEYIKPEIITGDDIKVIEFRVGRYSKGLYMRWECKDTIEVGVDDFIIQKCWRVIPSRTGWSAWQNIGSTKDLQWMDEDIHYHQDEKYRIIVLKEVTE